MPAVRHLCPPDVIQYHPRSFDDVESKAYSRRRENCSGQVHSNLEMHHYLPQQYLEAIWCHITQNTAHPDLAKFRGMFIVLSAKDIKLEVRSSKFEECRTKISNHLTDVLDLSKADLSNTWIDVGIEDTASGHWIFLMKSRCLERWMEFVKHSSTSPLLAWAAFPIDATATVAQQPL